MIKCPNCGEENSDTQKFCSKCGKKLNDDFSDELRHKINSLEQEQKELLMINNDLKNEYKSVYDENQEYLKINQNLNNELNDLDKKNNTYLKSNDDLDSKISKLKSDNKKISDENNILINKISTKTKKIAIVFLTLIICSTIVAGGFFIMNSGHNNHEVNDYNDTSNSDDTTDYDDNDEDDTSSDNSLNEPNIYQKDGKEFRTFDFDGIFEIDLPNNGTISESTPNHNATKEWRWDYEDYYVNIDAFSIYYWENANINDVVFYLTREDDGVESAIYDVKNESNIIVLKRDDRPAPYYGVVSGNKVVFIMAANGRYAYPPQSDEMKEYLKTIKF